MKRMLPIFLMALAIALTSSTAKNKQIPSSEKESNKELTFESRKLVNNARYWWGVTIGDITNDGLMDVVFIDNNSSGGFLGYYTGQSEQGLWQMTQIAEAPPGGGTFASGDLETGDIHGDGDLDVMAGVNAHRAVNIGKTEFPVNIYLNDGTNLKWIPKKIETGGIYNGRVADFEGDGDYDIFHLPGHEATDYFLLENRIK